MEAPTPIHQAEIFDQLNRILLFPTFNNSPVLSGFIKFIVSETLAGRGHLLKEYTIGTNVLSKKASYETQADASVRIHAGRLRRALYEYYNGPGRNDGILISVPKGAYVPKFEAIIPGTVQSVSENTNIFSKPTLAILPFHFQDEKEYFPLADGLCDQLCTEFTNFSELSVVSYYSSKNISNRVTDLREAGLLLETKYLLTGTIQSTGNMIRIRVQLVQSHTLHQIWACSYDKEKSALDTFAIQDDIVRHVVNQIGGSHGIIFREAAKISPDKRILDIKVYDAVFWYYYMVKDLNEEVFHKALSSMKEAVHLDPQYAMGWAILGETYVASFFYNYPCDIVDPLGEAVKCGNLALKIDSRCQHAYQALGLAYLFLHKQKDCIKVIDQWIKLKSNSASIQGGLGFCLICAGDYERGYTMLNESIQLNPYHQWWFNAGLSIYHYYKNEFEEAIYWADKLQFHSSQWQLILKTASLVEMGRNSEASQSLEKLEEFFPDQPVNLKPYVSAFIQSDELANRLYSAIEKVGI
jgi:TolB-like protein/Tfp pilus assembly protein PilF